jgi:hypothetical protein
MIRIVRISAVVALGIGLMEPSARAGMFVYPAGGQSAEQQSKDEGACHQWAQAQTGVDPLKMAQAASSGQAYVQPKGGLHEAMGGAARGAALGAIGGAIGGDAGEGAAIGAAVGSAAGLLRARRRVREQQQYQSVVNQEQQARLQEFEQAYATCLRGRGYTVSQ